MPTKQRQKRAAQGPRTVHPRKKSEQGLPVEGHFEIIHGHASVVGPVLEGILAGKAPGKPG